MSLKFFSNIEILQNPSFLDHSRILNFPWETSFPQVLLTEYTQFEKSVDVHATLEQGRNEKFVASAGQDVSLRCQY